MTPGLLIAELRQLHSKNVDSSGRAYCEHCSELCHSHTGLMCDEPDGAWPCATMQIVERYEKSVQERFGQGQ